MDLEEGEGIVAEVAKARKELIRGAEAGRAQVQAQLAGNGCC